MANKIYRPGKTKRDHKSGAHARGIQNKILRGDWNNEKTMVRHNGASPMIGAFPYRTCNGKRNRQR